MNQCTTKNKGFTLIELLVVISIIGLLASIILASLAGAKVRSENSKRQQKVLQWRNAFELYRSEKGTYPVPLGIPGTGSFATCLEQKLPVTSIAGFCQATGVNQIRPGIDFAAMMNKYIKQTDGADPVIQVGTSIIRGIVYQCPTPVRVSPGNITCSNYKIHWAVKNSNNCAPGKISGTNNGPTANNRCIFESQDI